MDKEKQEIVVVDVKMPFMSMVVFMVKWAIAAIPALIILVIFGLVVAATIGGFGTSLLSYNRYMSAAHDAQNKLATPVAASPAVPTTPGSGLMPSPHDAEKTCQEYIEGRTQKPVSEFIFRKEWNGELMRGQVTLKGYGSTAYFNCNMEKSGLGWRVIAAALP